ncbi:MAG: HU family DNA-binding protein [Spirochaetaceae bacterium]
MTRFEDLPERIQRHLQSVTESSGLPPGEDSLARITANWIEKRDLFEQQAELLEMRDIEELSPDDGRGVLVLTYSGSLLSLGPAAGAGAGGGQPAGGTGDGGESPAAGRRFEYASIPLRADVPSLVRADDVRLEGPIRRDVPARFSNCSIEQTSPVLRAVACAPEVSAADQERRIREATIFLTNGFVKLNRTLTMPAGEIEHFTMKSMVQYVARKNGLTQTLARQVIDDYLLTAEAGALLGERVPLGRIGRLYLGRRSAQKARMGRNPSTGEEMLIPAKPETGVPKMSFSRHLKERAASSKAALEQDEDQDEDQDE